MDGIGARASRIGDAQWQLLDVLFGPSRGCAPDTRRLAFPNFGRAGARVER